MVGQPRISQEVMMVRRTPASSIAVVLWRPLT
jgi:hypothetical protein